MSVPHTLSESQMAVLEDKDVDISDAIDFGDGYPTYDLHGVIGKLPTRIDNGCELIISPYWEAVWYKDPKTGRSLHCYKGDLLEAAFKMLAWCAESKRLARYARNIK